MKPIDLRSDTVTRPTAPMRKAMAEAEVGDDVYGEDPTVNRLEARAAEILGMEAALFVPSGTMGNAIAIRILTRRGDEVLVERRSHVVRYELSGMSVLSGVMPRMADAPGGHLTPEHVRAAVAPRAYYKSDVSLVVLENTHNLGGGTVQRVEEVQAVVAAARECGFRVHLDGARIWNAAVALGVPPAALVAGRGHRHGLPLQGPVRPGRLDPRLLARAHRGGAGGRASCSAAGCARPAFSPPPGSWPSTPWSRASPTTTRTRGSWRRRSAGERACGFAPVETNIVVATLEGRTAPDVVAALRERGRPRERHGRAHPARRDPPRRLARGLRPGGGRDRAGPRLRRRVPRLADRRDPAWPCTVALAAAAVLVLPAAPAAAPPVTAAVARAARADGPVKLGRPPRRGGLGQRSADRPARPSGARGGRAAQRGDRGAGSPRRRQPLLRDPLVRPGPARPSRPRSSAATPTSKGTTTSWSSSTPSSTTATASSSR